MSDNNIGKNRTTHLDGAADFSARNGPSSITNTVKGVPQQKTSSYAENGSGVSGKTREQTVELCRSQEYFCEVCEYYPLYPVHGHYECPKCHYKTKCCEGMPQGE